MRRPDAHTVVLWGFDILMALGALVALDTIIRVLL